MISHPLLVAADHFLSDERRRAKRGTRERMSAGDRLQAQAAILALRECSLRVDEKGRVLGDDADCASARGTAMIDLYGMTDPSIEERAITVIVDILHAVERAGGGPQYALDSAAGYYAEDIRK